MNDDVNQINGHGDRVKIKILETGMRLWGVNPAYVTARRIGSEIGLSHTAILYHFTDTLALKDAIAHHAYKEDASRVIVHLIASKHSSCDNMTDVEKLRHMNAIL